MTRIKLEDSMMDIIWKMSDGNPGAVTVIMRVLKESPEIDPYALMPLMHIINMDTLGIYGPKIWMLYKDVCKENIAHTIGILRANQMGLVSDSALKHAIENCGCGIDLAVIFASLKEKLPDFNIYYTGENKRAVVGL